MDAVCAVCTAAVAQYTCPRCNVRYCSLDCYRNHNSHCNAQLHQSTANDLLSGYTATEEQQRSMQDILLRLYEQDLGNDSDSGGSSDSATEADAVPTLDELTPEQEQEFLAAVQSGRLTAQVVQQHVPWWMTKEAAELQLAADGKALVQQAAAGEQEQANGEDNLVERGHALPAAPSAPVPLLSSLTKVKPHPAVQYQLLQLLYAYSLVYRIYLGDWAIEPAVASSLLLQACPALTGTTPPESAASALSASMESALQPPLALHTSRTFVVAVLEDVVKFLQLGRSCMLLALHQVDTVLFSGAIDELSTAPSGADEGNGKQHPGPSGQQRAHKHVKELLRKVQKAQRKLLFMIAWTNEMAGTELVEGLQLQVAAFGVTVQQHAAQPGSSGQGTVTGKEPGRIRAHNGGVEELSAPAPAVQAPLHRDSHLHQAQQQQQQQHKMPLIIELQ